jgi:hypothetical protein
MPRTHGQPAVLALMRRILLLFLAIPLLAGEPWQTHNSQWTDEDAGRILKDSPWARPLDGSNATVRWESARPIRLAAAKLKAGYSEADCGDCYAIVVEGLSAPADSARPKTWLKAPGREAIGASRVTAREHAVIFLFPRADDVSQRVTIRLPLGIRLRNCVQFEAIIGGNKISRKFFLNKMKYRGALEL